MGQGADLRASLQEKILGSLGIGVLVITKGPSFSSSSLSVKVGGQLPYPESPVEEDLISPPLSGLDLQSVRTSL